ncbi:MAG: hypothetical protein A3F33_02125 [Candidatus Woykebacteria bacterium RIFCSPHIGHO2_12_FULL_43_10]|uniref:Ribulose-phosphate 3-epimerase n=2 Tax=Candidatus Woykeibacteriota TaxID=1817899 RepID=A0A1G1WY84_9BACT|nr:MAG: hypothetical protein A3J50_02660 [Candidatus Woykebacteria bacterium RIFCSPHIGHO2_02_FULL_43_16b]OGY28760.1 MAG: hypothetical protein A3F33_02125 [Candidatus Woykebacteria bacterium RIFCSPHIGHO2_12_FULL_43_10]OGY32290.1 MAG: hypothetical protein A3A61_04360 [Candidatus Woykebacteria bacterium RIFCSPLOWO2_01_FULL_43_14]
MVTIIPAVLALTEQEYRVELKKASLVGNTIHVDIVDGKFSDTLTVGLDVIKKVKTKRALEAHLMVVRPSEYVGDLIKLGFKRVILPLEPREPLTGSIALLRQANLSIGLSLNPQTPLSEIGNLFEEVDQITLLGVNPGFSGQDMISEVYKKIESLVNLVPPGVKIEVDGGVTEDNAQQLVDAGADILAIGSHLVNSLDPRKQLEKILASLN